MSEFEAGQLVKIIQNKNPLVLGPTVWEITCISPVVPGAVWIKEHGTNDRSQRFDMSLLHIVEEV